MCGASFLASFASTSLGAGGSLLLVSMATALPISVVIPLHACVSFVGNLNRWAILHSFVDYRILLPFAFGTVIGVGLASPFLGALSENAWQIILGAFLVVATWWKPQGLKADGSFYPWLCGIIASFMSVFVGATKPLVATLLGQRLADHKNVVGTSNACATLPHLGKIVLFSAFGSAFLHYWWLALLLIAAGLIGVILGRRVLISSYTDQLKRLLKLFVTGLGLNLLLIGLEIAPWS
ncbi:MAG: sulfite exporter TauE/SafE family protein [Pseudomonadota bacterium]